MKMTPKMRKEARETLRYLAAQAILRGADETREFDALVRQKAMTRVEVNRMKRKLETLLEEWVWNSRGL